MERVFTDKIVTAKKHYRCDAAEGVLPLAGCVTGNRAELLEAAISARMALAAASDRDKAFLQDYHRLDAAINAVKGGAA